MSVRASSGDGRAFQFAGSGGAALEPGAFVTLRTEAQTQLGQIDAVSRSFESGSFESGSFESGSFAGAARGSGRLLGVIARDGTLDRDRSHPFGAGELAIAGPDEIEALQASAGAALEIGRYLGAQTATTDAPPARLLASRFSRHTFWVGQSGSGKTYALGVVLEQLLLHTALPIVVFDPNADFVRLGDVGGPGGRGAQPALDGELAARDIRVLRPSLDEPNSLRVRFVDLSTSAKAAVLHLHPLGDRAEFNELMHLEETLGTLRSEEIVPGLLARATPAALDLAARIENLRVTEWPVWAGRSTTAVEVVESRPDATVLDLGGFEHSDEPLVVAMAVLDDLWAKRESRRPVLLVIDEAHNLCAPENTDPLHVAVRERIIQIAAEGRKFGLWLLLSTQRPSRVHASIISQCDNLALMKMTSPLDLDELATVFGFVPPEMLARATRFREGEALFAGGFAPAPSFVRMGDRLTPEGGADVGVPLRAARPGQ